MPRRSSTNRPSSNGSPHSNQNQNQNNNRTRNCNICGRTGHLARDCRNNNNNNNNNANNGNNSSSNNNRRNNNNNNVRCDHCPNGKHSTNDCNKTHANHTTFCEWHNSASHADWDCGERRNPRSSRHAGESGARRGNGGDRDGDVRMEGFAYAQPPAHRPMMAAETTPYCRLHNTKAHAEATCPAAAVQRSQGAGTVCWKCGERGHLGDGCQNPAATFCYKCHVSGHSTHACASRSPTAALLLHLSALAPPSATRNKWPQPAWEGWTFKPRTTRSQEMREQLRQHQLAAALAPDVLAAAEAEIAQQERRELNLPDPAVPAPTVRVPLLHQVPPWARHDPPPTTTTTTTPDALDYARVARRLRLEQRTARDRAVRAKILKSRTLYKLEWANHYIRDVSTRLLETRSLTRENLWRVHRAMLRNPPVNIFRDPEAVAAIAAVRRPFCNACHARGAVVDRYFNDVPAAQDVVGVEDYADWGVFVAFECQCCKTEGWTYEGLEREEVAVEMEGLQG